MEKFDVTYFDEETRQIELKNSDKIEQFMKVVEAEEDIILSWDERVGKEVKKMSRLVIGKEIHSKIKSGDLIIKACE